MADVGWMDLMNQMASQDASMFPDQEGRTEGMDFEPVGEAVKAILSAAQEDTAPDFRSFFGKLQDRGGIEQYFATLQAAAQQLPDMTARDKLYGQARDYQTANLHGDVNPQNRPQTQHAMHQMLLQAMSQGGQGGGMPPQGGGGMAPPQATPPPGSIGGATDPLEAAKQDKLHTAVEAGFMSLEDALAQGYKPRGVVG